MHSSMDRQRTGTDQSIRGLNLGGWIGCRGSIGSCMQMLVPCHHSGPNCGMPQQQTASRNSIRSLQPLPLSSRSIARSSKRRRRRRSSGRLAECMHAQACAFALGLFIRRIEFVSSSRHCICMHLPATATPRCLARANCDDAKLNL